MTSADDRIDDSELMLIKQVAGQYGLSEKFVDSLV